MFIEICLGILTATFIGLLFVLFRISLQAKQSIQLLQTDVHDLSKEMTHLIQSINEFVQADLHAVSEDTRQLIGRISDLSADINNKSHSLNFLFKPLGFLSSKLDGESSSDDIPSKCETIPQVLKWIASSVLLFKKSKEFIKNHEKRT